MFILEQKLHDYLQTKNPHNFHLTNRNGMIQSCPHICKSKKLSSNFYFLKKCFFSCLGCPRSNRNYIPYNNI